MDAVVEHRTLKGVFIDELGSLVIDLSQPRSLRVRGFDRNNEWKEYLLRVSTSGKLSLV